MAELSYRVYCDVFALFSDMVLVSVEDFGGIEPVLSFICFWIRRRQLQWPKLRTHFVLATTKYSLRDIQFRLLAALLAEEQMSRTSVPKSVRDLKAIIHMFTELSIIEEEIPCLDRIESLCERESYREDEGLHFTASDVKVLVRAAIAHYSSKPSKAFNIVAASRSSYPVPRELGRHVEDFLSACRKQHEHYFPVVASALAMNAFRPGLHYFPPEMTFDRLYRKHLKACELRTGYLGLTNRIRGAFLDVAKRAADSVIDTKT
ncbi:hypothetical protein J3459_010278 [Metarhizium acridum]|nr:hypothetical protein J3459_010278 [Metarhizium acridum]